MFRRRFIGINVNLLQNLRRESKRAAPKHYRFYRCFTDAIFSDGWKIIHQGAWRYRLIAKTRRKRTRNNKLHDRRLYSGTQSQTNVKMAAFVRFFLPDMMIKYFFFCRQMARPSTRMRCVSKLLHAKSIAYLAMRRCRL